VGTTGTEPDILPSKKITIVPNPVSSNLSIVQISGFDPNDVNQPARLRILDVSGRVIEVRQLELKESQEISVPSLAGLYYIEVVSGRRIYGAMCVVQ
jgi:hypothetical protein